MRERHSSRLDSRRHTITHAIAPIPPATRTKQPGTTFNIVAVELGPDGRKRLRSQGAVFIRASGTGGVVYLRQGDTQVGLALFPRRAR